LLAAAAVGLGAFGAHGLKARFSPEALAVWHTAVQYHAWHALGLLAIGLSPDSGWTRAAGLLLIVGIVCFSGSLYAIAVGAPRGLGAITPIGGAAFIAAWLAYAVGIIAARTPA
jgi:uncharacterized membrane protein YgdD (TMEM256/DUF423 family)